MASFRFTKLKITAGYTLLLAILLFSLVFVHREMEALSAADDQQNLRTDSLFPNKILSLPSNGYNIGSLPSVTR